MMRRLWLRLRAILFRGRLEREMDEEMSAHVARAAERFRAGGLSPEDARAAALREFGNVASIKEAARDARGGGGVESVIADLRYGARRLARTPVSALTMIAIFALGIGSNAALFLFISSIVSSPLPGIPRDPSIVRIRGLEQREPGLTVGREFSYPEYREYASQAALFASVAAWTSSDVVPALFSGAATYVTDGYFRTPSARKYPSVT